MMPAGPSEDPDVRWFRDALRAAVERSRLTTSQLEQALGLAGGTLDAVFSGRRELGVALVFRLLRVLEMDLWQVLVQELPGGESRRTGEDHAA